MGSEFVSTSNDPVRLQEIALRHHRASAECRRLAWETNRIEDRVVFEELARREASIATLAERQGAKVAGVKS